MALQAAADTMPGRPRKYGDEETEALSMRLPESMLTYLGPDRSNQRSRGIETLFFEKELSERLAPVLTELRVWAAHQGLSYDLDRAEVLERLVRVGLHCEAKKSSKK